LLPLSAQENQSSQPLQSDALQKIKSNYENCVFEKGKLILRHSNFRDAIDFAPLACRKQLLQSKKYLLDSAFKVDVIDELVSSIEEGVRIDLVNKLIDEMNQG
jgi:hypothetical protein